MTTFEQSLAGFTPVSAPRITDAELSARIAGLQKQLRQTGTKAVWLDASSSLQYYTGLSIGLSERVHGAIVPAEGGLSYVSPHFEVPKLETMMRLPPSLAAWRTQMRLPSASVRTSSQYGRASSAIVSRTASSRPEPP